LDLIRIEIVVATGNAASIRVAEKLGAQQEGILRNRITVGNRTHDAVMFSLTPKDFGLGGNGRIK
jgi:RimJ/RimL family protein N-acetyltransferase